MNQNVHRDIVKPPNDIVKMLLSHVRKYNFECFTVVVHEMHFESFRYERRQVGIILLVFRRQNDAIHSNPFCLQDKTKTTWLVT